MPNSSNPSTPQMAASVRWAYITVGVLNAPTPLLTASTPVMAVQPAANARSMSHSVSPSAAPEGVGGGTRGWGCPPPAQAAHAPVARIADSVVMNR